MRLTKFGHACVRLEDGDRRLVIDPGTYTDAEALSGATGVLVTHEHADHVDVDKLEQALADNPALSVHGPTAWADTVRPRLGPTITGVTEGDSFDAAGFEVTAVGGRHAEIIDGLPGCANVGFMVAGAYHPGDSLFVPDEPVGLIALSPWHAWKDR